MASCVFEIRPLNRDSVELRICTRCGNGMIINIEMNLEKKIIRMANITREKRILKERDIFVMKGDYLVIIHKMF